MKIMNKLKCTLYVGNTESENKILEYIQNFDSIETVAIFRNGIEMIDKLPHLRPDLLFINIGDGNLDTAEYLRIMLRPPFIIGITSKLEALKNYLDDGLFDVLSPDFTLTDFCRTISKIITIASSLKIEEHTAMAAEPAISTKYSPRAMNAKEYIILKHRRDKTRLRYDDILYIQNVGNTLKITDSAGRSHYHTATLVTLLKELPYSHFARINRSTIVNCDKIDRIANQSVHIQQAAFRLSRTYSIELMERFDKN